MESGIYRVALALVLTVICCFPGSSMGDEPNIGRAPDRYGISADLANTYDPGDDISFLFIKGVGLFDYGKVWQQDRPKELCFKVEGGVGSTLRPDARAIASAGMLALYYLNRIATPLYRPYFEAGIGIIYTDFRVEGQGLRFNFNPQLGIGAELLHKEHAGSFVALRLHHLSNGELHRDNRGVNSIVFQIGKLF